MKKNIDFSANGKLLLTGEYLVLAGAEALAFPVRFGQTLKFASSNIPGIRWISLELGKQWFSCEIETADLRIISTTDQGTARQLTGLLKTARSLQPGFLENVSGLEISVNANYPLKWGLGSSSTLISLLTQWAGVDPFSLFRKISNGSGYDIACATRREMLLYRLHEGLPDIRSAIPGKALREHACFAYLGKKQQTAKEVSDFLSGKNYTRNDIERISELSGLICDAQDPGVLIGLIKEHEAILGGILKKKPIASQFQGFPGTVKSLGAWGGDFGMFVSHLSNIEIKEWLKGMGFSEVFSYEELKIPK
jgi:mevalonate kinase